jgi:hypothetical protein
MTKSEVWSAFVAKNPQWLTEGARLTPAGIRKVFEETWRLAHDQGVANGRALEGEENRGRAWSVEDALLKSTGGFFR